MFKLSRPWSISRRHEILRKWNFSTTGGKQECNRSKGRQPFWHKPFENLNDFFPKRDGRAIAPDQHRAILRPTPDAIHGCAKILDGLLSLWIHADPVKTRSVATTALIVAATNCSE